MQHNGLGDSRSRLRGALGDAIRLQQRGLPVPRSHIYGLLQACSHNKDLQAARQIRSLMDEENMFSASALVDHLIRLFTLCQSLPDAKGAFARVPTPTVFTWNAIISAHTTLSDWHHGLLLYHNMQQQGIEPNRVTFLCVLKACVGLQSASVTYQAHGDIILKAFESDLVISNMLIDTYCKCGNLQEARNVFDKVQCLQDVISWSAMISGYAQHGFGLAALDLYSIMQEKGISPENTTYSSVLKACGSIRALDHGRQIHDQIRRAGLLHDNVIGGTLIDMYIRCGQVGEARLVFDGLPSPDEVSWGTIISGYAQHGHGFPALELFGKMQQKKVFADRATWLCVLKACGTVGAIQEGRLAHEQLIRQQVDLDAVFKNTLVDMYARCSSLEDACKVFYTLTKPDIVSWGAIISGYAQRGQGKLVQESLENMQGQGYEPDSMMFMSILSACSHAGLLEEGCRYFKYMSEYNVRPGIEHYNSMVDLFSRSGHGTKAEALLLSLPAPPDDVGWTSLVTGFKFSSSKQPTRCCLGD